MAGKAIKDYYSGAEQETTKQSKSFVLIVTYTTCDGRVIVRRGKPSGWKKVSRECEALRRKGVEAKVENAERQGSLLR